MCVHRWLLSVLLDVLEMLQEMREGRPLEKGDKVFLNWNEKVEKNSYDLIISVDRDSVKGALLEVDPDSPDKTVKGCDGCVTPKARGSNKHRRCMTEILHCWCNLQALDVHVVSQEVPKHVDEMWSRGILGERHQGSVRHSRFLRCEESHASSGITD